jgi:hypothetical protein
MNDSAGLIAFKVNGTLKAISWGHHQHPAQIFLMNKPARNGKLSNGFNKSTRRANHPKSLSSPSGKNILIFRNRKSVYIYRYPVPLGGAFRERHERGDGLRWTQRRARRAMPKRTGEIVWV